MSEGCEGVYVPGSEDCLACDIEHVCLGRFLKAGAKTARIRVLVEELVLGGFLRHLGECASWKDGACTCGVEGLVAELKREVG